jgi:hypothetical protein
MRKYLVPVEAVPGSGNFLAGFVEAGVPVDVLWGPTRYVANKGNGNTEDDITTLNDLLWLPTQFEMTGESEPNYDSAGWGWTGSGMRAENAINQVTLEYYTENSQAVSKRIKSRFAGSKFVYWLSSASSQPNDVSINFSMVNPDGVANSAPSFGIIGVVPAFCVR